jgi:hypothetical protein
MKKIDKIEEKNKPKVVLPIDDKIKLKKKKRKKKEHKRKIRKLLKQKRT